MKKYFICLRQRHWQGTFLKTEEEFEFFVVRSLARKASGSGLGGHCSGAQFGSIFSKNSMTVSLSMRIEIFLSVRASNFTRQSRNEMRIHTNNNAAKCKNCQTSKCQGAEELSATIFFLRRRVESNCTFWAGGNSIYSKIEGDFELAQSFARDTAPKRRRIRNICCWKFCLEGVGLGAKRALFRHGSCCCFF